MSCSSSGRSPTLTSRTYGCSRSWPANGRCQESSAAASFTEVGHLVPSPRDSGFGDCLPALIWTLEAHGLIRAEASSTPWQPASSWSAWQRGDQDPVDVASSPARCGRALALGGGRDDP